jgi:hypothetical protein
MAQITAVVGRDRYPSDRMKLKTGSMINLLMHSIGRKRAIRCKFTIGVALELESKSQLRKERCINVIYVTTSFK